MRWKRRILLAICAVVVGVLLSAFFVAPAFAISDPDDIEFGSGTNTNMYQVFQNLDEDGDMLFVAETYIHYATPPTDYACSQAFLFELLDTDGTTVLYATPVLEYENYVTSIYLTATQAESLTWGSAYSVRLTGSPSIFGTPTEGTNQKTASLMESDYIDDTPAGTSVTGLRIFCLDVAEDLEANDDPTDDYIITVEGVDYLTTTGGNIFLAGVPNLNVYCPTLFQTTSGPIELEDVGETGAYAETRDYRQILGETIGNGISNFGSWMGMGDTMAGIAVMFGIILLVCGYLYIKTQSPLVPDAIAISLLLLGGYLGLVPLALAFTVTLFIAIITLYYFFTRGAL